VKLKYLAFDDEYLYISWNMDLERKYMIDGIYETMKMKMFPKWNSWKDRSVESKRTRPSDEIP